MTSCQACGTKILGSDRFCRNCGSRVSVLVEDLSDTHKFVNEAPHLEVAHAGMYQGGQVATGSATYQISQGDGLWHRFAALIRSLLKRKFVLLAAFLALSLFTATGLVISRSGRNFGRRAEQAREAEAMRRAAEQRQAENARRNFEVACKNALGFKPEALSTGEYPDVKGVFVASLTSDYSPAALARIQAADILTEFAGQPVQSSIEMAKALDPLKPGSEVSIKLYRDGEVISTTMHIGDRSVPPPQPKIEPREEGFLGLGDLSRRCCIPGTKHWGLEVRRVIDNSPADLAGLQLGDLITEFNQQPTLTPDEFTRQIHAAKPRSKVKVKFYRGNSEQTVELTVGHGWDSPDDRARAGSR